MAIDFSWLAYYVPIFGFLFVLTVMYAILTKTKILSESPLVNIIVSFVFGIVFVSFLPAVNYVSLIIPWFVTLVVCLFLFMVIIGFSQKEVDKIMKPWVTWVVLAILMLVFLVSAIYVFNPLFTKGLAEFTGMSQGEITSRLGDFVFSESFFGGALLLIVAIIASVVLTKSVVKK